MPSRTHRIRLAAALVAAPGRAAGAVSEPLGPMGELREPRSATPASRVSAGATHGPRVADIVLYAGPGRAATVRHTRVTVRAGRAGVDRIADVPRVELQPVPLDIEFGRNPLSSESGSGSEPGSGSGDFARGGGHRDYPKPHSEPLKNIARTVAGAATSAELSGECHA
ncbi:hypothetical protein ACFVT1_27370 [Streptomyces sp. NPDC057963]|uniref:hypothetical protein n=1 Tax=Streptomyces sp. NPDC057963 TaxID=3346290 RepID=UPI0036E702E4